MSSPNLVTLLIAVVALPALAAGCAREAAAPDPSGSLTAPQSTDASPASTVASTGQTAPDACSEIAGACHTTDHNHGSGVIHECHELGHAHQLDACVAKKKECLDACSAAH